MIEHYLQERFGIVQEDILISPLTNKKATVKEVLSTLEERGHIEKVYKKIQSIQTLGRKGVIVYLTGLSELNHA
ncbi:hypothetical protein JCM9140_1104 [Halalkalibacter wakoensis JCM 9140]|uniref:Uncharacterized protein n=1 Tax=Halalkalibacter wakoensis JCM 9140 TaxID=1236970 RepID=W4PZ67_9BACI|nr:hypothetical protein [Halalkalibacter wakoensis]GAE25131.1 hypothetical protein JCM9140_1104 [Halalkalibacter wakoensis JCM 9140]